MPEIFHHGTSTEETPSGYPQMPTAASNVIAFPFTADDADAATFPLNKVVFTTDGASLLVSHGRIVQACDAVKNKTPLLA